MYYISTWTIVNIDYEGNTEIMDDKKRLGNTDIQKVLAGNIKKYRKELEFTQLGLSDACGFSTNYIGLIESMRKFPSPVSIEKIAKQLQVPSFKLFSNLNESQDVGAVLEAVNSAICDLQEISKELNSDQ